MAQILIIEDDPTAARLLARELRDAAEHYEVLTADSANAGLAALADHAIDCVVLDYMLPDASELNCLRVIRLAQPDVPVILNTAAGSPRLAEQARRLGAGYIEKSRHYVPQLTQLVRRAISERELERANARIAQGIFVGRGDELARLRGAVGAAAAAQGGLVLLTGEPGIGKTSLAMQVGREVDAQQWSIARGACYEDGTPPYQPWKQIQRTLGEGDDAPGGDGELPMPELAPSLAGAARWGLYDDVAAWLRRLTRRRPLLMLLEDLQWADEDSVRLLTFLAREAAVSRLLILATYRDGELAAEHPLRAALPDLRRERLVELRLRGLAPGEVGELVTAIAQGDIPEDFVHALHRRSEGNPFFVQEILRYLVDEGIVFHQDGQWMSDLDADEMPIPDSVRAVIDRRIAHLPVEARDVLSAAASIGREFSRAALRQRLDDERVGEGLRAALHARVVSERHGLCRFSHALIYETVRDGIRPPASPGAETDATSEASLFRLDGQFWTIRHDGRTVHLRDINGMRYLAYLLEHPDAPVEALELPRLACGLAPTPESRALARQADERLCDERALREVAAGLAELDDQIEIATEAGDLGSLERARERRAALDEYLRSATGLGGRLRRRVDQSERARSNVTKCIRRAIGLIVASHPSLGRHLDRAIRTGRQCVYAPAPADRIAWTF